MRHYLFHEYRDFESTRESHSMDYDLFEYPGIAAWYIASIAAIAVILFIC